MDAMTGGARPVALVDRIEILDVLRGVAICGILLMNIPFMGMTGDRGAPPLPAAWNADWISWGVQTIAFEGTMRGLFTMLFGAGMLLMLRKAEGSGRETVPFDIWTRRCWALIILGIVQFAVLMWPGEILVNYGVAGLFLLAVRTARPKILVTLGAVILILTSIPFAIEQYRQVETLRASIPAAAAKATGKKLTDEQAEAIKAADEARKIFHPTPADVAKEVKRRTEFPSLLAWSTGQWSEWNMGSGRWYLDVAESLGFMMIGMALFRTGVLTGTASAAVYRRMILVGYGAGVGLRLLLMAWGARTGFDLDIARLHMGMAVIRAAAYEPARLAITLGHVGLLVILFRNGALGRATPLRALGRMALTAYTLQSLLTSILFYALGWVGAFGFATLMGIAVAIWLITGLFATWWLGRHDMGPAEQLLRAAAYGSFRRTPAGQKKDGMIA